MRLNKQNITTIFEYWGRTDTGIYESLNTVFVHGIYKMASAQTVHVYYAAPKRKENMEFHVFK